MNNTIPKAYLRKGKEDSINRYHPWLFSGAIDHFDHSPSEGDVVSVYGSDNRYLGSGHYQIGSIMVRLLTFSDEPIDTAFYAKRLTESLKVRERIGLVDSVDTNSFRLVHGEGDNLPGLVIDIYDRTAVMQAHSVGIHKDRHQIASALQQVLGSRIENIYYKSETTLPYKANLLEENGFLVGGHNVEDIAMESGLKFHVDWLKGQKTGFFVDQRENRKLLEHYAKGMKVLNMFCYTGGFSFYAMRGGATLVHSVDSSQKAIDLTPTPPVFRRGCLQVLRADGGAVQPDYP